MTKSAYFDISPLFEEHWTGIPVVTAGLVESALEDKKIDWNFIYETIKVDRHIVEELLLLRRGDGYLDYLERQLWKGAVLDRNHAKASAAIFPNMKALRHTFKKEAQIYHDFSTLLTPQFHNVDTINHHANRFTRDIESTDTHFCVSKSTALDLMNYFSVPEASVKILPMGIDMDASQLSSVLNLRDASEVEPYICVVGTVEPRKNGKILFDFFEANPDFLSKYKVIFVGRDGWLNEKNRLMNRLDSINSEYSKRVIFSGFVSEITKMTIMALSKFVVYPSFFEGYGIPVAEAALMGKYVVCSNTSSLPEVYPSRSFLFDPRDVHSFSWAVQNAENAANLTFLNRLPLSEIWIDCQSRSWKSGYKMVSDWVHAEGDHACTQ